MPVPMASHNQKMSHCTSFGSSWANKCSCAIDNTISIMWCQCQNQMHHMIKKDMLYLILIILTKQMKWCHWWCHCHDMVLMLVASHDQKSCFISFWALCPNKWSGAIDDTVGIMWYWHEQQWHHMTKRLCCTLFQLSSPNEYNSVIDNALGIRWFWCQCTQCQMIEKVMLACQFDHLELTNTIAVLMMLSVSCDTNSGITWPIEGCYTLFQSSWPNK